MGKNLKGKERSVQPKVLQQLLGHASIKTTMDRYVHVTDESLVNAIRQFQQATPPECTFLYPYEPAQT